MQINTIKEIGWMKQLPAFFWPTKINLFYATARFPSSKQGGKRIEGDKEKVGNCGRRTCKFYFSFRDRK